MFLEGVVLRVEEKVFLKGECSFGRLALSWVHHLDVSGCWECGFEMIWLVIYLCFGLLSLSSIAFNLSSGKLIGKELVVRRRCFLVRRCEFFSWGKSILAKRGARHLLVIIPFPHNFLGFGVVILCSPSRRLLPSSALGAPSYSAGLAAKMQ